MTVPRRELTGDYDIDPEHSRLGFIARHATITKVRGSFNRLEGWLHMANYPDIVLQSTSVEPIGDDRVKVTGDLTVNDITHPMTIEVEYSGPVIGPFA
jgi:polyisoprenoid-binding protein YceI